VTDKVTKSTVTKSSTGLKRLYADLRRHPVKAHFKTHFRLGLYLLQNHSEKGLWQHAQNKNPHHTRQLSLSLDLPCMCPNSTPKSFLIPWVEYHLQDIVHSIGEKPSSTETGPPLTNICIYIYTYHVTLRRKSPNCSQSKTYFQVTELMTNSFFLSFANWPHESSRKRGLRR